MGHAPPLRRWREAGEKDGRRRRRPAAAEALSHQASDNGVQASPGVAGPAVGKQCASRLGEHQSSRPPGGGGCWHGSCLAGPFDSLGGILGITSSINAFVLAACEPAARDCCSEHELLLLKPTAAGTSCWSTPALPRRLSRSVIAVPWPRPACGACSTICCRATETGGPDVLINPQTKRRGSPPPGGGRGGPRQMAPRDEDFFAHRSLTNS